RVISPDRFDEVMGIAGGGAEKSHLVIVLLVVLVLDSNVWQDPRAFPSPPCPIPARSSASHLSELRDRSPFTAYTANRGRRRGRGRGMRKLLFIAPHPAQPAWQPAFFV